MTDDLVNRAREAMDGVTPGPWRMESRYSFITHKDTPQVVWDVPRSTGRSLVADTGANVLSSWKDAAFIAAARELVPTMTDRLEALEAENARLREALRKIATTYKADQNRLIHSERQIIGIARAALQSGAGTMADNWQPIETAPKDGTLVILLPWGELEDLFVSYWIPEEGRWANNEWSKITHWMPLPAPPAP